MKKIAISTMAVILLVETTISAQPVSFGDANLKAAVEIDLDVTDPTPTDMLALTFLDANNRGIVDLTGLEYATNLSILLLYNNRISDISALSGLTKLTSLVLPDNQITDISALDELTNLILLWLGENQITDISALSGLANLEWLDLEYNQISNISALSGLTNLLHLYLDSNWISNISALSGLTNLTELGLHTNWISDISPLSGLTNLVWLWLYENQITDISALSGLANLWWLDLGNNQISNISALSGLTNLSNLFLYHNRISDISALSGMTNLVWLMLDANQIADISALDGLRNLTLLLLDENQITDISSLSGMTNLVWLWLQSNPLNADAYCTYIQQIIKNNPGIEIYYDPPPPTLPPCTEKMIRPVAGYVTSYFGWRLIDGQWDNHEAIDIAGLTQDAILGETIVAPARGIVDDFGVTTKGGHWIRIKHDVSIEKIDGTVVLDVLTSYSHLMNKPSLKKDDPVNQGDPIGQVGKSGTQYAHLHFVVHESFFGNRVDPLGYVNYSPRPRKGLKIEARCPIDIIVIDPEGYLVSKNSIEIEETVTYLEEDFDGDGDLDDRIWFTDRKVGNYTITVVPEPSAQPDDTYSLEVTADNETIILAENVLISDIPDEPYTIRSTEIEITQIILATINDPDTLNLKSKGKWITCYIELPEVYDVDDIDVGSILLEYLLEVQHSDVQDDVLMVKVDRQDVIAYIELVLEIELPADVTLMVTGELNDGTPFEGIDTIRVIEKGGKK